MADLQAGRSPIYEPGLDDLMQRNMRAGRLTFSQPILARPCARPMWCFWRLARRCAAAMATPISRMCLQRLRSWRRSSNGFTVITTKSTVPVSTSREIEKRLKDLRPDVEAAVCSNPEFLREGSAIQDFTHPDRVLVGTDSAKAREVMERLYKPLALRGSPVMFVSRESAELAKYAANAFLALKISFINEIADLCEEVGADVQEVASAIGKDRRIGDKFLHPGPGYGGSCFPKDVSALIRTARENKSPVSIIEQVERVNHERKIAMAGRIEAAAGGVVARQDGRDSRRDVQAQYRRHARCAEPRYRADAARARRDRAGVRSAGPKHAEPLLPGVVWCESALEAADGAHVLAVVTEWNEFRALDLKAARERMAGNAIVDLRNIFQPGRPATQASPIRASAAAKREADRPADVSAFLEGLGELILHRLYKVR